MGSYLGLPESLGGPKSKIFAFVKERLQERINGWSAKFLSKGGKEVMIKSVAAALPTYVMSCFRLPKTVTSQLSSALARFWWSNNGCQKGIHWVAWKKMCRPKLEGGIGFRTIDNFNTALLAKQLWRLIECPESLFSKVFKGRYYRNSDPMDPRKVSSPSYGWRSIISARPLVQKGLIKRVGNGASISVWKDAWIPATCPRPATGIGQYLYPNLMVNHLVDPLNRRWNLDLVRELFNPSDAAIIRSIPLNRASTSDYCGWHFTASGKYTVKSGYSLQCGDSGDQFLHVYGPDFRILQAHVWKLKCPRKLHHFIWQILAGSLPVNSNLKNRGINCDPLCVRCGTEAETINHALFECPPALQVWALSKVPSAPGMFPGKAVHVNVDYLFWRIPISHKEHNFPWLLWYIWKARNDKVFRNLDRVSTEVVQLAESEALAWELAQMNRENIEPSRLGFQDLPPDFSGFVCNVDGSWKDTDLFAGLGWFCYQDKHDAKLVGAKNLRRSLSPLHAEFEALLWAMTCMIDRQRLSVIFATDCSELVSMVSSPQDWPAFSSYLESYTTNKTAFSFVSLFLIPRSQNSEADGLARSARLYPTNVCYVNSTSPIWATESF